MNKTKKNIRVKSERIVFKNGKEGIIHTFLEKSLIDFHMSLELIGSDIIVNLTSFHDDDKPISSSGHSVGNQLLEFDNIENLREQIINEKASIGERNITEILVHKTAVHFTGSKYIYYSAILESGFLGFKDTDERMEYTFVKDS